MNPKTNPPQEPVVHELVRLRPDIYKKLEDQFGKIVVTRETTPEQISFQLGAQSILKVLRDGLVI